MGNKWRVTYHTRCGASREEVRSFVGGPPPRIYVPLTVRLSIGKNVLPFGPELEVRKFDKTNAGQEWLKTVEYEEA